MIIALQIAIAALLFLIIFAIVFIVGVVIGCATAIYVLTNPEAIKQRLEREFKGKL